MVIDRLTDEVRQESPWNMMFTDDIVICSESKEQVERSLERWRYALERIGMKVSRSKTEYMCVNERGDGETVLLQGVEVPKVKEGDKVREARLRWYGHVQKWNAEYIGNGRRMLCLELPGKRRRGRPKTRFMDVVREDMRVVGVSDGRQRAREIGDCGTAVVTPNGSSRKEKKKLCYCCFR